MIQPTSIELLRELHKERQKFTGADRQYMKAIVDKLVERGVYPAYGFNGRYPALSMVENYGVDWHQFSAPHFCPQCGVDLRDWENGAPGKREVLVKDLRSDTSHYECPDCKQNITDHIAALRSALNRSALGE